MVDLKAEEAEFELIKFVDECRKRYDVSYQTMNFILASLAQNYAVKAIASQEINKADA